MIMDGNKNGNIGNKSRLGTGRIKISPLDYKTKAEYQKLWNNEFRKNNPEKVKERRIEHERKRELWWYGKNFIHPKSGIERHQMGLVGEQIAKILLPKLGFYNIVWFNNDNYSIRAFFDFKAEKDGKICAIDVTTCRAKDVSPSKPKNKMSQPEIARHLGLDFYVLFISISKMIYCLRKIISDCKNVVALKESTYNFPSEINVTEFMENRK